ncbi:hypothetical protein [Paraburkholderia humisilvae]|uniref:ASCH domain-containing protein n=1 Tax=Paraburkholderia humisilvae TaxID=627669 RepID=A0A6J5DJY1_9BURK|nr:hypothetical protein [Paraburkholderia humisilvae]CAB3754499.1 hypothetical protein LMG29542_02368 [Paraburkholderia humisilvae]
MKAISIWQPHASLLLVGPKRYETRGWRLPRTIVGTRVAIHAAKATRDLIELAEYVSGRSEGALAEEAFDRYLRAMLAAGFRTAGEMPRGCIIGSVVFKESVPSDQVVDHGHFGDFSAGRFAWRADQPRLLPEPVPFRGMQGFFDVPDELFAETV